MFNLDDEQMQAAVSSFQIPVKPQVLTNIQTLMAVDEPDIEAISNEIISDVGLSAAILKIINSPFYGMSRRVSEIKQAVMILGLKTIDSLVTALCLKQAFNGEACISLERFWDDSTDVANAMTYIGSKIKSEIPIDMLYTIGLFANCGIPLLAMRYNDYKELLITANANHTNSIQLEEQHYQTNHAVLGYFIASSWNLPKDICGIVLCHHEDTYLDSNANHTNKLAFAALKVAENMVERVKRTNTIPGWAEIEPKVFDTLGISEYDYQDLEDDFTELFL